MDKKQYREIVRGHLFDRRFQHSVNAVKAAQGLAVLNRVDPEKARLAGILHDTTKETPPEEQLKIMDASGITLTSVERCTPKLWRAMVDTVYLRYVLGIEDRETLDVVRYHTTECASMSLLEKIVFMVDFISDEQDYEGIQELREAAHHDLQEAVMVGLIFMIQDLLQS